MKDKAIPILVAVLGFELGTIILPDHECPPAPVQVFISHEDRIMGTGSSGDPLTVWTPNRVGARVIVTTGPHAGRHGAVTMLPGEEYAEWLNPKLEPGQVRVSLDGGSGQTMSEGGQGGEAGISVNLAGQDLKPEE